MGDTHLAFLQKDDLRGSRGGGNFSPPLLLCFSEREGGGIKEKNACHLFISQVEGWQSQEGGNKISLYFPNHTP